MKRRSAVPGTNGVGTLADQVLKAPLSDLGNAKRLVLLHGTIIRYCHDWRKWLIWDGRRWRIDTTGEIERLAKDMTEQFLQMALKAPDEERRTKLMKYALVSGNVGRLRAMIDEAQSEAAVAVLAENLDVDPYLLNCKNGTIDLRTAKLRPHNPQDLITKLAPVTFNPQARRPVFEAFFARIMGDNRSLMDFVQRAFGYALTGDVSEKALFLLHGEGDNGKTTLVEAVRHMLGDYAGLLPIESLMTRTSDGIPNDIAQLRGLRFVISSETEQGRKLAESRVKQLTGRGTLQARFLYGEYFQFAPTFKIFMDANHQPEIRGDDNAIWNRIKLVPFAVTVPKDEQDKSLPSKLEAEAPGILAWAVEGCLQWRKHGLGEPEEISAAVSEYRDKMDIVKDFIEERCTLAPDRKVKTADLFGAFKTWCEENELEHPTVGAFGNRLKKVEGINSVKVGKDRGWHGIGIDDDTLKSKLFVPD